MNNDQSHAEKPTNEKAWYLTKGDHVPEWIVRVENGTITFGVDVLVTSRNGGYEIRPYMKTKGGDAILNLTGTNESTPNLYGGGNGIIIIGYDRQLGPSADAGKVEGDGWSMSPPKFHRYPYFVENISGKWCLCKHHGNGASHTISVHETAREARDAAPSEGA